MINLKIGLELEIELNERVVQRIDEKLFAKSIRTIRG